MSYKLGQTGNDIRLLQTMLNSKGYNITIDGIYGPETHKANLDFNAQKSNVGNKKLTEIAQEIIKFANKCVGQEEISGNVGFKTPWFHKAMVSVGFQRSHPWCSYFAELCWKEGYRAVYPNKPEIIQLLDQLFSGSVIKTRNNFVGAGKIHGFDFTRNAQPGSLVIWQSATNPAFGHIGIVEKVFGNNLHTIEGNTDTNGSREGLAVAKKIRSINFNKNKTGLDLLGFISVIDFE